MLSWIPLELSYLKHSNKHLNNAASRKDAELIKGLARLFQKLILSSIHLTH